MKSKMRENNLIVLALLGVIIGASGLAFGAYSAMLVQTGALKGEEGDDGDDGTTGPPGTVGLVVGLWEHLQRNKSYSPFSDNWNWLISAANNLFNNSGYIILNHNNTRYYLVKNGLYRITLRLVLTGCNPAHSYYLNLYKNGVIDEELEFIHPTYSIHTINAEFYISSDSDDYFELNCFNGWDDSIDMDPGEECHQLVIEYVGDY